MEARAILGVAKIDKTWIFISLLHACIAAVL
jgi:hypothetical protein